MDVALDQPARLTRPIRAGVDLGRQAIDCPGDLDGEGPPPDTARATQQIRVRQTIRRHCSTQPGAGIGMPDQR
jgi:hypothetical protein